MQQKYKEEDVKDLVRFVLKHKGWINERSGWRVPVPGGDNGMVTDGLFKLFISVVCELEKKERLNKK